MPTTRRRPSRWRALLRLLWRQPLYAIPFALFFGTVNGARREIYAGAYVVSLYFAFGISLSMWVLESFILPRVANADDTMTGRQMLIRAGMYVVTCLVGAFAASLAVRFTLIPTFLGSVQNVVTIGMFTLLFTALFMGIATAMVYYRKSLERAKADQELHLARRIQRSFLLSQFPAMPRLEVHAINVSSREVSGDFYDVVPAGQDAFLLAIADVAGKGVPAALLSSMLQASLRTQASTIPSVATILSNINALVYRSTAVNQFATFFLARVEESKLELAYSNAGHNYPVVFRNGGARVTLERGGTVVGILESARFEEDRFALQPGDRVLFYTDGLNEAANERGELFGEERLYRLMEALPASLSARETAERVLDGVRAYLNGVEAGDDMTVMVLRVLEPDARREGVAAAHALPGPITP
jgi:serine phosphatase RsbU (regulator of sigma subunit)